jgi:hypothetical protein
MSRRVLNLIYQPDPLGPSFGRMADPADFMKSEQYAHEHAERVTREYLSKGETATKVGGFGLSLTTGMGLSIASGVAVTPAGLLYDANPEVATVLTLGAAHASLPRIDLVYATLATDAQVLPAFRPYRQIRSQSELAGGVQPYLPVNFNNPTETQNSVTVAVRAGTPASSPTAPAAGAGEVALFRILVPAASSSSSGGNVTDVRPLIRPLHDAWTQIDALLLSPAFANLSEAIDDRLNGVVDAATYLTATYDDPGNVYHLDVDMTALLNALDPRYVNATGDTINGDITHNGKYALTNGGGTDAFTAINASHRIVSAYNQQNVPSAAMTLYQQTGVFNNDAAYGLMVHANGNRALNKTGCISTAIYAETGGGPAAVQKAGHFNGDVLVTGAMSKGSGTFLIDHPLDPLNRDLRHGFVESNCYGLVYWQSATLVAGEAHVNLDALLGFTNGTCAALWNRIMVVAVRHPDGTHVTDDVSVAISGDDAGATLLNLASATPGDTAEVRFLICAERADPFMSQAPFVDVSGNFVSEADKPVPTAGDLAMLVPQTRELEAGDPLVGQTISVTVPSLIGKQGYPWQPAAVVGGDIEDLVPTRTVTFVEESE